MPKFKRIHTHIEAIQWSGEVLDFEAVMTFAEPMMVGINGSNQVVIYSPTGLQQVRPKDYIAKEPDGVGVYVIRKDIFEKAFEEAFDHTELRA